MICRRRISRRRTPASRNHRMISVDSTTCICCWTKVDCLSDGLSVCRPVFANQFIEGPCTGPKPTANQLYCTVDHQLCSCWLTMSEASCTAVLRVLLANKGDWTDDAAMVLFTVPLLMWSLYFRLTSAQHNRNIRLDLFPK